MNNESSPSLTAGQASIEAAKTGDNPDAVELTRDIDSGKATGKSWEEELETCVKRGKSRMDGDFFVVILTKKERLLQNVVRRYFIDRKSCPHPEYDQTVFRYVRNGDVLEYMWTIPDWQACEDLKANALVLSPELRDLHRMVMQFEDGSLKNEADRLNEDLVIETNADL